jgi:hypothetical protein
LYALVQWAANHVPESADPTLAALALPASSAPNAAPESDAQSAGPYTGVAIGVLDRFRHIESSFTSNSSDYYRGRFTYSFSIDAFGNVTGRGDGTYLDATWHLDGVNGNQGAFNCEVPMFTQRYTVRVTGNATADTIALRFAMEGSREWNNDHYCGANFTGYASDTSRLADSLELVQPPEGIRISRANPSIPPLRKLEVLGDQSDRRVNLHEWAFTIAAPGAPPPPEPPGGGGGAGGGQTTPIGLVGTVGPGARISLTLDGRPVTILLAHSHRIVVRDRSRRHNFHLTGPGVNRSTSVRRTGTFTWNVTLRAGTYRYLSDPQGGQLRRTVLVR